MDKKIKLAFTFMSRDEMSVTSVSPFSFRSCDLFGDNLLTIMFVGGFRTMAGWMVKPKTETLGKSNLRMMVIEIRDFQMFILL